MNTTTLVRIRVQTTPPIEPLKVWHTFSPTFELQCIKDLTGNIAQSFGLSENGDLSLELDGFVLLPSSPIGTVRDGDIIIVKLRHNEKRKADEARMNSRASGSQARKKQKTHSPSPNPVPMQVHNHSHSSASKSTTGTFSKISVPPRPKNLTSESSSESSSSSSDDSSDSSSGSESNSSTDSDSESASDSDSSSESDGPPRPRPILHKPTASPKPQAKKPTITASPQLPKPPNPLHPPVPPGQGKRSTQDRNSRRRKLQKHRAAGTEIIVPRAQSSTPLLHVTNQNEDSTMAPVTTTTQTKAALPIAPAKNANKNKRRGFDKDMASTVATRVVFSESSATPLSPPIGSSTRQTTSQALPIEPSQKTSPYKHYHVVPPSQLPNLPSNVIVTSVDVEAVDGMEGVGEWFDGDAGTRNLGQVNTPSVKVSQSEGNTGQKVNWVAVDNEWEKEWHEFHEVGDEGWKDLKTGTLLAWKALTLDPATCTPCTKIHLARVVGSPDLGSNQIECFIIDRPGSGDIIFSFRGKHIDTEEELAEEAEEEPGEIRMVEYSEIKQWKVVT